MYCLQPFYNIHIQPIGNIVPCCKYNDFSPFNITKDGNIENYLNSPQLQDIYQQLKNNQIPQGCKLCDIVEKDGFESKRTESQKIDKEIIQNYTSGIKKISLNVGTICNLKCRICNPILSSAWHDEWKLLHNKIAPHHPQWIEDPTALNNIIELLKKDIVYIDWTGGEPFIQHIPQQLQMLDAMIDSGRTNEITLHYTTNGSTYPSDEFWKRWKHFKLIDFQFSMDDTHHRFEYNRYPASWNIFVNNLFKVRDRTDHNLRLSIAVCLSIFTKEYIQHIKDWCMNNHLPKPWFGPVEFPIYYSTTIENDKELLKRFWEITNKLDSIRSQSFKDVFPELYNKLKQK